jgi:polar amino acid transport system substrate-binding protein
MKKTYHYRLLAVLLVVAALCAGLMACGGAQTNEEDRTTFTVGFDAEFPPYGYKDADGNYVGFDLDLAAEVAKRNGWTLVKQPIDWDSKDMELNSGSIDCIWNGFTLNGREADYTWSTAYVDNSQVVIVRSDSDIKKLSDLAGKNVVVQSDSSALAAFTGEDATEENIKLCASFKSLTQVGDYNSAFLNLEAGSVDAICMDVGVANYQLKQRGNKFVILDENVSSEQYGIGFRLGNTALRDKVQTALNEMLSDGTFAEIAEKWELSDSVCLGEDGTDTAYLLDAEAQENSSFGEKFVYIVGQLARGMLSTISIFVLTLVFSLPLGLLLCFIRMSKLAVPRWIAKIYISIMRGTPLMLQLLVVFFGPYYLFGVRVSSQYRFAAVIIGFSLNYAAYFAEIYRSGIEAIPAGQYEAADVLGYTKSQTFMRIIFPQMVKHVLPPVTNEVITLVKDTSLAFALAYTEMFTLAKQLVAAEASMMPLFIAGLFYYVFNFVVAVIMERIEKKMQYYR